MNHVRASRPVWKISAMSRRTGQVSRRTYAAEPASPHPPSPPPNPNIPPKEPSRVGAYYKSFSYPVLKSFLIALFTYQVAYYSWLKLETIEEAHDKKSEISDLQRQLKEAVLQQKHTAQDKISQAVGAASEVKDIAVDSVKEGLDEAKKTTDAVGKVAKGGWWPW